MKKLGGVFFYGLVFLFCPANSSLEKIQNEIEGTINTNVNEQKIIGSLLGKNRLAQFGAWSSLALTSAIGSFLTYKTAEQIFENIFIKLPFLNSYYRECAKIATLTTTLPLSLVAFIKSEALLRYFFYILYAGERVSPLLARDALHDVRIYVQHLQTIKSVQKELYDVINQINELSQQKKNIRDARINQDILNELTEMLKHDDAYIQTILLQLQKFLPQEELIQFLEELSHYSNSRDYCIAPELEGQTQAIINQLQMSISSLGDDSLVLNCLMKGLVNYWQNYTASLADGINLALQFCNEVHFLEQIISKWLNRSLLCA